MIKTVSSNSVAPIVLSSVRCLLLLGMQLAAMQLDAALACCCLAAAAAYVAILCPYIFAMKSHATLLRASSHATPQMCPAQRHQVL